MNRNYARRNHKRTIRPSIKIKLCAIALFALGIMTMLAMKDLTALAMAMVIGLPALFAKDEWF